MISSRNIVIFISLIWGFALALLFRKACTNDRCTVVKVPEKFIESQNIIKNGNKCYYLNKYFSKCTY